MHKINLTACVVQLIVLLTSSSVFAGDTWLFSYPLAEEFSITCPFGCYAGHTGTDYGAGLGDHVLAAEDGIVSIGWDEDGFGNFVTLSHNYSYQTIYAHLSEILVSNGQFVAQGSIIGKAGNTGWVIGDPGYHLHFEVRQNGTPVDPYNTNHWLWCTSPPQLYSQLSYSGTYVGKSHGSTLVLTPGSTANCWIDFRCNPPFYWSCDENSSHYVALHSVASNWTDMEDSPVIAGTSNLLDDDGSTADPNGVARFGFTITAPSTPGTYTLRTRVYHPHSGTFITGMGSNVSFTVQVVESEPPSSSFTELVGNFNSGSRSDVTLHNYNGGDWYVALSTGSDFTLYGYCWTTLFGTGEVYVPLVGDFNGDGKDDVGLHKNTTGQWYVALSSGSSFEPTGSAWTSQFGTSSAYVPLVGDFNGDGKDDVGLHKNTTGQWYVALSSGSSFVPTGSAWTTLFGTGEVYVPLVGDFNGDGKDDVGLHKNTTGQWYVALSS
ncbi:MAG: VCBS repeat domain-containing M23 family metallopeptidase, partial [Patescibacteria group bacterium]|nr:VCBS repeat domain-containing M23 family metallopeptidase [Patescibacteria group bacterium]